MDAALKERLRQWEAYNQWERDRMPGDMVPFETALAWMWDAWRIAARFDPAWATSTNLEERVAHLGRIREGLSVLSFSR